MPIKGLSDRICLPRLGKIRLGIKVEGDRNPYPQAVDYFVCPDAVKSVYGDKPRELNIIFPTEDASCWASQFYRCYSRAGVLICKGDGERAAVLAGEEGGAPVARNPRNIMLKEVECHPEHCPEYGHGCRRVMNLQFLLPCIPGLGVWQLDTSSYRSIMNINSGIKLITAVCGRISMIPLILRLVPQEAWPHGFKKIVYVLSLDIPGKLADMLKYARLPLCRAILPTPDAEAPQDLFPSVILEKGESSEGPRAGGMCTLGFLHASAAPAAARESRNPDGPGFGSLGDLFTACYKHYGLSSYQVIKELGLSCKEEIADLDDAWQQIKALYCAKPRDT